MQAAETQLAKDSHGLPIEGLRGEGLSEDNLQPLNEGLRLASRI